LTSTDASPIGVDWAARRTTDDEVNLAGPGGGSLEHLGRGDIELLRSITFHLHR
jgi:hypothetical protein